MKLTNIFLTVGISKAELAIITFYIIIKIKIINLAYLILKMCNGILNEYIYIASFI